MHLNRESSMQRALHSNTHTDVSGNGLQLQTGPNVPSLRDEPTRQVRTHLRQ